MQMIIIAITKFFKVRIDRRNLTSKVTMDIKTFAFLDTETTGLPTEEYNKTKLTELCLTIVQSDHVSLGVYPRVQNKLNFCFNPCKMVNPVAEELTGLSNILLEYQPKFTKETVEIIEKFLQLQQNPICFVAHNGNGFDYPILRAEISKTGSELPKDILCIDTLEMFRDLHEKQVERVVDQKEDLENIADISQQSTQTAMNVSSNYSIPMELCDGFDELICQSFDEYEKNVQTINETTPSKTSHYNNRKMQYTAININNLYFDPDKSFSTSPKTLSVSPVPSSRKQLKYGMPSFKLVDIYKRLTNKSSGSAHKAEDDCNMLLECAATLGQEFSDWANTNAVKFCDIPMMRPGRKIGLL